MAKSNIHKTTFPVALQLSALSELRLCAELLAESQRAIGLYADELSSENLRTTSIGVQAEGVRLAMSAQTLRAVTERLSIAEQLTGAVQS
jgi:hypothetical protein